ncbi:MAG: prefoldin subunit alpha [Candidatus Aenigmarchaeota archaeon]|nr:prefoldin subunit alpha [Candidatus Aenigmarchaeota archaeon]
MENEEEAQEKMLMYRMLESRLESAARERELVSEKFMEVVSTISALENIEKNSDNILFKMGSEVYANGKLDGNNKLLIEIGAGIVVEKSLEEGKQILTKRREELERLSKETQNNIEQITEMLNKMAPELNELMKKGNKG